GAGFTQNWTTADGHFVAGAMTLQPVIDSAGFYILKIINSVNGCMSIDSVNVAADFALPLADAGLPRTIDCNSPQVTLDGTGSSQGGQYIYQWSPLPGNIVSGGMGLQPVVDASGLYLLEVTDSGNGCSASSTVAVDTQADFPQVAIEVPGALGCSVPQVGLMASATAAPGITYLWTTANGNIVSGDTSLMPVVDAAGNYTLTVTDANNGCSASATVEVLQNNNAPTAVAGIPFTLPCGANSAFLDGTGSELGFEIFYEWTTPNGHILAGANTLTPEINAPGTYILAVTDGLNGCAGTDTVLVSLDNNAPVADAGLPDTLTCDSPSLLLDGSGSDSGSNIAYSWTTPDGNIVSGSTGPTPQVDAPGTYLLTVLDTGNNCETIASVQVAQVTDGPPISLADAPLLSCTDTLLTLSGSAAGSNVDYLWTAITGHIVAGETTASPSIDAAGSYLFTATDRTTGCTSDTTLLVLENTDPPTALATSPLPLDCGQTELVLDATASSSGPGFGYLWTTQNGNFASGETSATPVVTAPGDYLLQVTDLDNGCTATAAVEVTGGGNLPVVSILPPNELTCILQEIAIDASNSTFAAGDLFEWTTPDGNIVSGASTLTPTADAPGTYTLSIANPQNGCSATDSIIILQNTNAPQAAAGADLVLGCDGSAIQIQGSLLSPPDAVLDWVFAPAAGVSGNPFVAGGQTATPLVNLPGSYSLTATDPSNGCVFMDEMSISPGGIGGFSFVVGQPNCSSPTGSILFADVQGGLPPFAYSIDGTDFSPQAFFDGLPPGNYALTLRDSNGCEAVWQAQIIDFQPFEIILDATASLPLGTSIPLNAQTTLPLDEIAGIVWTPGEGLSCTACLRPFASPSANTDYVLTITDSSGCSATAGIHLLVTEPKIEVFVPNAFSPNGDGINDVLVLFANGQLVQRVGQFRIFGRWGEAVFEAFDFPPNDFLFGWDGRHRGQLMEPGVFVWLAEIVLADGQRRVLEGEVVLLR
ncbi:MAG TPA: hypothetical protein ENJ95_06175, partial [Bacteroidetes bacterium]|nr:hypothetical protein [Bacteroidota bacterium]